MKKESLASQQAKQWEEWAKQAQDGNKRAYHSLLQEISSYIRNVLSGSFADSDAIEDVMQEVLISVHKSLHTYSSDRPFKPWLLSIINFRRTDYLRQYYAKRKNKTTTTEENYEFEKENVTNPTHWGELKDVERAISKLPKQQQRIFRMIKVEGYTAKEVANEMQMKESAVKVSAHRAMIKIRTMLE